MFFVITWKKLKGFIASTYLARYKGRNNESHVTWLHNPFITKWGFKILFVGYLPKYVNWSLAQNIHPKLRLLSCKYVFFQPGIPARNFSHSINCFEKLRFSRNFKISLTFLTLTVLFCVPRLVIYSVIVLNAWSNEMVFEIFLQFPNHRYNTFLVKKGNYCK